MAQDPNDRDALLTDLEDWVETPMIFLSAIWLVLVVVELVWGTNALLEIVVGAIWLVFIAEFALRLWLAPRRLDFLRHNVVSLLALAAPVLRIFRLLRVLRLARGVQLVRVVGAVNRGMGALKRGMRRRGLGYVVVLSGLVLFAGAAGLYALESGRREGPGFTSFWETLWWTAMLLASIGVDSWPQTAEGRVLCLLIAVFGLAMFGYITASFASFFVGRDATEEPPPVAAELARLRAEVAELRAGLAAARRTAKDDG